MSTYLNPADLSETPPKWDLSSIVPELAGCDSAESVQNHFRPLALALAEQAASIAASVARLNARAEADHTSVTAEEILAPILVMQAIDKTSARYQTYFHLSRNEHFHAPEYATLYQDAVTGMDHIKSAGNEGLMSFALPQKTIDLAIAANPEIGRFRELLLAKEKTEIDHPSNNQTHADPRQSIKIPRLFQQINTTQRLQENPTEHIEALTQLINAKLFQEWARAKQLGDKSPDELHAARNGLPDGFIAEMLDAVPLLIDQSAYSKAAQEAKDASGFKGSLGNPEMPRFTWPEAANLVVDAFASFHPKMGEVAAKAFREGWIDADPRADKHPSNYNHYHQTSADYEGMHPFISVHFEGTLKSIFSLAHELGHAVADYLSGEETGQAISGNALRETFAHFAETLVADYMVATLENPRAQAAVRLTQFDMSTNKLSNTGMGTIELELYRATAGNQTPYLGEEEIASIARSALRGFVTPQAMQQMDDQILLKEIGKSAQILLQRPFYNTNYTLAESAAMHMADEYRGLEDENKQAYADHWVRAMQLGSKLDYGGTMEAMGMEISTPEMLIQSAKKTQESRMAESATYLIEASRAEEYAEPQPRATDRILAERTTRENDPTSRSR